MSGPRALRILLVVLCVLCCGAIVLGQDESWESLNARARQLSIEGRYDEAIVVAEKALEAAARAFGERHLTTAVALNNLAELYRIRGRFAEAEARYRQALSIKEERLSPGNPSIALTLNNLGVLLSDMARYDEAEPLLQRALAIKESALGARNPGLAGTLNNMALLYFRTGRFGQAEALFRRSLAICVDAYGESHLSVAYCLNNLGLLSQTQGREREAVECYRRVLAIYEKLLPADHPDTATVLNNLASLLKEAGMLDEAESLARRVLAIYEKTFGPDDRNVALALNSLAGILTDQGKLQEAEPLYWRALAVVQNSLGRGHPHAATSLNNLALLCMKQGRYAEAEELLRRSLVIGGRALGRNHPDLAATLDNLGELYERTGSAERALAVRRNAFAIYEKVVESVFALSSEKEKFAFLATVQSNYRDLVGLVFRSFRDEPAAAAQAYDAVLARKGLVVDALSREREALARSGSPEVREAYRAYRGVCARLSSRILSEQGEARGDEYLRELRALEEERERLDKALARLSTQFAMQKRRGGLDSAAVSHLLPPGSVLVEIVCMVLAPGAAPRQGGGLRYAAFVLPAAQVGAPGDPVSPSAQGGSPAAPALVDLGDAATVNGAVRELRQEMALVQKELRSGVFDEGEAELRATEKGRALYRLVIAPLLAHIGERTALFIAPDGDLNLIPFGLLVDEKGRCLLETHRISYLSCGRDLASLGAPAAAGGVNVIVADPDYDMPADARAAAAKAMPQQGELRGGGVSDPAAGRARWRRLPGTRAEAKDVEEALRGQACALYLGRDALEEAVKRLDAPRRLHVATHGFFEEGGERGGKENPMTRSGLVFAGANEPSRDGACDDGILTALEISGMSLWGTELVVLSACETGLGSAQIGEGVFGLRRAFQLAGARTVVMSLWSVPDKETQVLMGDFYRRMRAGEAKADALRSASLAAREKRRAARGAAHPFFWGAFISVGEP